tara:strand:+ start:2210 stop:2956 length:747 start_codon:yes stop_codon:yes gene_type:complete
MKEYLRIIGFSLLASFLIFIGKNDLMFKWLVKEEILSTTLDIEKAQLFCFILGIFWAGLWLPIQHSRLKTKQKKKDEQFIELLNYNKESYFELIKNKLNAYNVKFDTHIFRPQKGIIGFWQRKVNKKTILKLINVKGISDTFHHKSLTFEVNKLETQGLVGKTFKEQTLSVDLDLTKNNYSLTQQHLNKLGTVEFCSAIPIYNEEQTKINAILSVDSQEKFNFSKQNSLDWEKHMVYYAAFVDKHTNL